jgi:glycine/D-amino acid oxidase-like deaminating enzyme
MPSRREKGNRSASLDGPCANVRSSAAVMAGSHVIVVGAGVMGLGAALSLRARGWRVTLVDLGPVPHPLAASTDISKIVRMEYGADEAYMALGERALDAWRTTRDDDGSELFHETGVLFIRKTPMSPGQFEHDSYARLVARGHHPDRLDGQTLAERFPAWREGGYADGFLHAKGGFVESGRAVAHFARRAAREGVRVREGVAVARVVVEHGRCVGVLTRDGETLHADAVVTAVGAWTSALVPELAASLRSTGHPVFHLRPSDPSRFVAERFPVFGAAIADTGWYGFPLHPREGVVKVARHAAGRALAPDSPERRVDDDHLCELRAFLAESLPALADAEVVATRMCMYCDSHDGHFWIAEDPSRRGLVVAAGDSGHAFKFAPVLGDLIADAVEGRAHALSERFRWRVGETVTRYEEAARQVTGPASRPPAR